MDYKGKPVNVGSNGPQLDIHSAMEHFINGSSPLTRPSSPLQWRVLQGLLRNENREDVIRERERYGGVLSVTTGYALGLNAAVIFDYPPVNQESGELTRCPRVVAKVSDDGDIILFDEPTADKLTRELYIKSIRWIEDTENMEHLKADFVASLDHEFSSQFIEKEAGNSKEKKI